LIICAIEKHPDSDVRDSLTHTLFNLIKRPDGEQRRIIMDVCSYDCIHFLIILFFLGTYSCFPCHVLAGLCRISKEHWWDEDRNWATSTMLGTGILHFW
jgi:hypothetical protein